MSKYNKDDFIMGGNKLLPDTTEEPLVEPEMDDPDFDDVPDDVQGAIGHKSRTMFMNRVMITKLEDEIKVIAKRNSRIEKEIGDLLESQEIEQFKTEFGSHTRKEHMYVKVDDWDKFFDWAVKSGSTEFIPKSVNVRPFRTMLKKQNKVPVGLSPNPMTKTESKIDPTFKSEQLSKLNKES